MSMRLLMIEDNVELARGAIAGLVAEGYRVDHAANLATARTALATHAYDLILLDIHLPDGDGASLLPRGTDPSRSMARRPSAGGGTPIIVVTARSAVADRIGLLDSGADDTITKPVDVAELAARCRAVLRRHGRGPEPLQVGDLVIDADRATVNAAGVVTTLRNRELRLLQTLARQPGRLYSKRDLHDHVFGVLEAVSDNAIEVYVARLRKCIAGSATTRIETVRGIGYRLVDG